MPLLGIQISRTLKTGFPITTSGMTGYETKRRIRTNQDQLCAEYGILFRRNLATSQTIVYNPRGLLLTKGSM